MGQDPNDVLGFDEPTKKPDGEVNTTGKPSADANPGNPIADPQNLAKDSQAQGGIVGTDSRAVGASSLGSQPGFAGTSEADVKAAVDAAPEPEGKVRTSWAESGNYTE